MVGSRLEAYLMKILHLDEARGGRSEEANDAACLGVESNLPEAWARAKTGHGLHVAENGVEEARASGEADGADGDRKPCGDALELRVVGEGE